ncbi:MAG: rhodanese-like domain-containing protein [Halorientalis sp.]
MDRRRFLAAVGAAAGLAGCSGGSSDGTPTGEPGGTDTATPTAASSIPAARDGYPAPSVIDERPPAPEIDPSSFETLRYDRGVAVPLVPIGVAYDWYRRREARFADARGGAQYERSHVTGAVLSPAGGRRNDPVTEWPTDDRIVCYCGCPHHLSTVRAGDLLANGYEEVYAIDEGFWEWHERGYPISGRHTAVAPSGYTSRVIEGRTDPADAGRLAWARTPDGGNQEATPIRGDGRYELTLVLWHLDADAPVTVETPSYTLTAPIGELTSGRVTREGTIADGRRA